MRIIAGDAKGRTLKAPVGNETRPTSDKVREALFSILMREVPDSRVLDLFGGTGALGLEAMSRGAESCVICDVSAKAIMSIQDNVRAVMKDRPGVTVIKADYRTALNSLMGKTFDLVFLDPPYRMEEAYAETAGFLAEHGMIAEDGIIVAERSAQTVLHWPAGWKCRDTRTYRDTCIELVVPEVDQ